mmetsp:Transcript_46810/g.100085  ORF Transcript_46810/g.100085 Transcript_46810/m.100085 type:complete len:353 (-) Transcript_46810:88-1146(-)
MTGFRSRNGTACTDTASTASPACRWADVEASEGESDEEWDMDFVPPTTDDSYRGAPLATLEDSCSGLNSRLKCAAELEVGPKDFTFLLDSTQKVAPDSEEAADLRHSALEEAQRELEASTSSPATSSLSANAPEFVPTMTMVCPLVGICSVASTDEASFVTPQNHFAPDPYSPELLRLSPKQGRNKGGVGRKRNTPPAIQVPDRKRTKSEERRLSIPEEAKPNKSQMEMPEATEEEWQQRIKKRELAITLSKRSHEYQRFQQLKMNEEREEDEPLTPDPRDRSVSKRKWKHDVDEWRNWLQKRYGDEGQGSVASTEEWLSVFTTTTEEADGTATTVDGDEEGKDEGDDTASV